jgi:hypothetical protein
MGSIPATPSTKYHDASCFPPSSVPAFIEISIKLIVCLSVSLSVCLSVKHYMLAGSWKALEQLHICNSWPKGNIFFRPPPSLRFGGGWRRLLRCGLFQFLGFGCWVHGSSGRHMTPLARYIPWRKGRICRYLWLS